MMNVEIVKNEEAYKISTITLKVDKHVIEAVVKEFSNKGSHNYEVGEFIWKTEQPGGTIRRRVEIFAENVIRKGICLN